MVYYDNCHIIITMDHMVSIHSRPSYHYLRLFLASVRQNQHKYMCAKNQLDQPGNPPSLTRVFAARMNHKGLAPIQLV